MKLSLVLPTPVREIPEDGGATVAVAASPPGRTAFVRLRCKPSVVGPVPIRITIGGVVTRCWTEIVLR